MGMDNNGHISRYKKKKILKNKIDEKSKRQYMKLKIKRNTEVKKTKEI